MPFITQLSKFYDTSNLGEHFPTKTESSSKSTFSNCRQKMLSCDLRGSGLEDDNYDSNYQTDYNDIENSLLKDTTTNNPNKYGNQQDEMNKAILDELNGSDNLNGKNLEELTEEERHNLLIPQQRETIRKIRELEDAGHVNNNENIFKVFMKVQIKKRKQRANT